MIVSFWLAVAKINSWFDGLDFPLSLSTAKFEGVARMRDSTKQGYFHTLGLRIETQFLNNRIFRSSLCKLFMCASALLSRGSAQVPPHPEVEVMRLGQCGSPDSLSPLHLFIGVRTVHAPTRLGVRSLAVTRLPCGEQTSLPRNQSQVAWLGLP